MSIQRACVACLPPVLAAHANTPMSTMSAFITSHPIQSASKSSDTDEKYHSDTTQQTPSKQARKDKRRRVEESLALVDDPASRKGSPLDDLLHPSSDRRVSIQWSQIAYITIRDQVSSPHVELECFGTCLTRVLVLGQVFSPLIQGALWAFGGILLSSMWAGWNGKSALASKEKSSSSTSGLRSYLSRLVGPALAGTHTGPRNS